MLSASAISTFVRWRVSRVNTSASRAVTSEAFAAPTAATAPVWSPWSESVVATDAAANANLHHAAMTSIDKPVRAAVAVTLMGGFGVGVDGVPTARRGWARRNTAALVKVLALAPGHHLHREHVMDLLWPDEPPEGCAPRLHKAAHFARRAAGSRDAIVLRNDVVWLFPGSEVTVDAIRFEQLARVAVAKGDAHAARRPSAGTGASCCPATATRPGRRTAVSCCTCAGSMCCGSPASGGNWPSWTRRTRRQTCN